MRRQNGNDLDLGRIVNGKGRLYLSREQRATHLHIVGNTGSGKTKFLEGLIRQDILASRTSGCGMLLIDPHGSLYDAIIAWLARTDLKAPVVPVDLRRDDWIISYNLLRPRKNAGATVVIDSVIEAMAHVWGSANTDQTPRFARWAANLLRALYDGKHTLAEAVHLIANEPALRKAMTAGVTDKMTKRDWALADSYKPREFEDEIGSTVNRLRRFVGNDYMRTMFGLPQVSLDLGTALDEGSIILVNLSRRGARISKEDADLFATLLLNDLWTAAQERGKRADVKPFYVYLDEFQRFVTPTIAESLDEARGFGLHLTLSHQFPLQLRDAGESGKRLYNSVMENARSKVCFSLSTRDNLEPMAEWLFSGTLDPDKVKLELWSTKVMSYRTEYRTAYNYGRTASSGGTDHSSWSSGTTEGESRSVRGDNEPDGNTESWNTYFAESRGDTSSWSNSDTSGETVSPVDVPVMGEELSHVQFESLEEQLFRAMAVLFDQEQRQYVSRLIGMRVPVSVFARHIPPTYVRPERVEEYVSLLYEHLPFALKGSDARAQIERRSSEFQEIILKAADRLALVEEPWTAKRRIHP